MKEKLTNNQFILVLHGPSCGGKSTVSDIIFKKYGGIFKGKSDTIKRLISDYDNTIHHDLVGIMTIETMRVALEHGLSVMKEGGLYGLDEMVALSQTHQIPLFIANISAPWEILLERFDQRIASPIPGVKINTDHTKFKEIFDTYHATKIDSPLTFDSSIQSPDEIVTVIISTITHHFGK
ncbi:MAG: hypothetical protein WCG20_00840 [bacterium]